MSMATLPNGMQVAEINSYETKFLYDEIFERETYAQFDLDIPPGGIVLDVGANIGMFSLYVLGKYPGSRAVCIEPAPHCLERLRPNVAGFGDRVQIAPVALGDSARTVEFSYYPNYSIISGMFADEGQDLTTLRAGAKTQYEERFGVAPSERELDFLVGSKLADRQTFDCEMITMSELLEQHGISEVALAKIDVERAEGLVLAGVNAADWNKIRQFVVEVHDQGAGEHKQMVDLFVEHGYEVELFTDPQMKNSDIYVVSAKRSQSA